MTAMFRHLYSRRTGQQWEAKTQTAVETKSSSQIGDRSTKIPAGMLSARPRLGRTVVAGAGTGAAVGTLAMSVGLMARMWGREDIEWSDRSWRLLENQGQLEVDDWSGVGGLAGVLAMSFLKSAQNIALWKRALGGAGIGSVGGVAGYMAWRYGVHGRAR